jgi:PAS domain S-box-containing protein
MYDVISTPESRLDIGAVVATSPAGAITYWPPSATEFYGINPTGAIGQIIFELLKWNWPPPNNPARFEHRLGDVWVRHHRSVARTQLLVLRTTISRSIGPEGDDELLYYSTLADVDGMPADVDQPAFLGESSELAARCNAGMIIECVSAGVGPALGLSARDLIGRRSVELVHPDDRGIWERAWEQALARPNNSIPAEIRGRTSRGDWRIYATEIVNRLSDRAIAAVVINSLDITEQRRAESAARAAEITLKSVLESMGRGIWVIDPSGATIFANRPMTRLLGLDPDQMSGYSIHDLWDHALSSIPEQRKAGMRSDYELPVTQPDGKTRWLRFHAVPRHNESGEFTGSLLVCSDTTELREDRGNGAGSDRSLDRTLSGDELVHEPDPARIVSRPDLMKALSSHGLTQREFEIVDRLIRGDRVPVIATTLFVSQSTIRNQLAAVFRKIGVHSQQELIAYVRRSWR